jgi:Trk K+ transport system NAD-binding subunit
VLRHIRVVMRLLRIYIFFFLTLLLAGTLFLHLVYTHPETGQDIGVIEALDAAFVLIFLGEMVLPFPTILWQQVVFLLLQLVGLFLTASGLVNIVAFFTQKGVWQVALASTYHNHIVVCGLGRIGYRVVKQLLNFGEEIIGIENDEASPFLEEIRQMNVPVLLGDARVRDWLEKANIDKASAIVVCTADDLTNLDIALDARELNPEIKVVLRMFDNKLAEKVRRGFGIHTTFSTTALAAPVFAAAATRAQIDYSFYVDEVLMNVARVTVSAGTSLERTCVTELEQQLDMTVLMHKRGDHMDMHPPAEMSLEAGDCLVVFASRESLLSLRAMGGKSAS